MQPYLLELFGDAQAFGIAGLASAIIAGAQIVGGLIFFVATIAELNRTPFDLAEAEQELVAGFNVEYSGMKFAVFYLTEYLEALSMSVIVTTIFFGGWYGPGILDDWSVMIFGRFTSGLLWFFLKIPATLFRLPLRLPFSPWRPAAFRVRAGRGGAGR